MKKCLILITQFLAAIITEPGEAYITWVGGWVSGWAWAGRQALNTHTHTNTHKVQMLYNKLLYNDTCL